MSIANNFLGPQIKNHPIILKQNNIIFFSTTLSLSLSIFF